MSRGSTGGVALAVLDATGTILDVSPALETASGCARADLVGRAFDDALLARQAAAAFRTFVTALSAGQPVADPGLLAGVRPPVVFRVHAARAAEGAVTSIVAVSLGDDVARMYLDETADWVFAKDPEHRVLYVNPAYARALGRNPEDIVGLADTELWPEAQLRGDREKGVRGFHADDDAAVAGQTVRLDGHAVMQLDGRSRVFDTIKVPLRNALGETYGVFGFSRDVTQQRAAEALLRGREERYRLLVEQSPVPLYVHDGTRVLFANQACLKLLGYRVDELVGLPLLELVHAEDRERVRERVVRLREAGESGYNAPAQGRMVRADGSIVFVEVVAAMVRYEGRPAVQAVVIDVTERERAREAVRERDMALQKAAAQLAEAQRIARLGYFEYDLVNRRAVWSDETHAIFERDREVPPTRDSWLSAVHPDDRRMLADTFTAGLRTQTPISLTYRIVLSGGRIKHVFQHVRFEADASGTVVRAVGTLQDVTEREVAAEEKAALETQLRHAQRLEALGTLAAGIAHDFNNVLTAMMANAELSRHMLDAKHPVAENLKAIEAAGARAAKLVQQILTIGRRQPQKRALVAPATVVDEALRLVRASLRENVELVTNIAEAPAIYADATQLVQVVMNLCTNAWQALDGRRGRIEIGLRGVDLDEAAVRGRSELSPGRYAELTVSDDGVGMAPEVLERVFDPFFTTKPVGIGSGLGLAVVHGIVESHGAVIDVSSAPGCGTSFRLLFPAAKSAVSSVATKESAEHEAAGPRLRVMLVDDELPVISVFRRSLALLGFDVTAFTRAADALSALRKEPQAFHVVVSDYRMPEMSGLELAEEIRRFAPDLPLLLMSGNLDDRVLQSSAKLGIAHHLAKPCSIEDLRKALSAAIASRTTTPRAQDA